MIEKQAYIKFIAQMLEKLDLRKIKVVYEFVLGLTN